METTPQHSSTKSKYIQLIRYVAIAGFTAGSLDGLAAIFILSHGDASSIFKFIASGIYGKQAFNGGEGMVLLGIAIHYMIACTVALVYFTLFGHLGIYRKNILVNAVAYGLLIYLFMNIIVLSISNATVPPRTLVSIARNAAILIVCVALPIVYIKRRFDSVR